jgi:CDGSH-type Zn-finger protein
MPASISCAAMRSSRARSPVSTQGRRVGDVDRLRLARRLDDGGDRPEYFLVMGRHARMNIGTFRTKANYALCRCGQSKTKPFCDGSHAKVGFDGTETASREPYLTKQSVSTARRWSSSMPNAYAHPGASAIRTEAFGGKWRIPTIQRSRKRFCARSRIVRLADWSPGKRRRTRPSSRSCRSRGPIWLRGGLPVVSADGFAYQVHNRVTLCRCGQSKNKPFCDGAHAQVKFRSY